MATDAVKELDQRAARLVFHTRPLPARSSLNGEQLPFGSVAADAARRERRAAGRGSRVTVLLSFRS